MNNSREITITTHFLNSNKDNSDYLLKLLESGNCIIQDIYQVYYWALIFKLYKFAKRLLDFIKNDDGIIKNYNLILINAIRHDCYDHVEVLVNQNDFDRKESEYLLTAIENGHAAIVELLLSRFTGKIPPLKLYPAFFKVAQENHLEVLKLILHLYPNKWLRKDAIRNLFNDEGKAILSSAFNLLPQ
jgi:hypothetical protein